jgi:hypothetical protein
VKWKSSLLSATSQQASSVVGFTGQESAVGIAKLILLGCPAGCSSDELFMDLPFYFFIYKGKHLDAALYRGVGSTEVGKELASSGSSGHVFWIIVFLKPRPALYR